MSTFDLSQASEDFHRIEQAIRYIEANTARQPELSEIAASLNLSEYHFQRLFTRWAGISPKRFLQFLTKENAKQLLDHSASLLEATYEAGLSSPGRLHDLFIQTEAVTPGEYKTQGQGIQILYGFHPTPFGECLLAMTDRGICWLAFVEENRQTALHELKHEWANASFEESPERTAAVVRQIFQPAPPKAGRNPVPLHLHLRGTNFQIKVWEALLNLPEGGLTSYETLSEQMGHPRAARAVGNAVGRNPIAYLIPCHRVLRKSGEIGNYRYGAARKRAILGWEMAQMGGSNPPME
jgi:AraC family transcriptional regulator, regulatory protein of adaptative response / methylated-DNA-[protein]-cysteine methyltransferase